jgi:hypothetical protein
MSEFYEEPKPLEPKAAEPKVIDAQIDFHQDESENKLVIHRHQEIPDDWMQANRKQREDSMSRREGDWMPVASIPVEVAYAMKEVFGHDVWNEPFRKTIAVLKAHGLDHFILTNKQV